MRWSTQLIESLRHLGRIEWASCGAHMPYFTYFLSGNVDEIAPRAARETRFSPVDCVGRVREHF
jgi:hypothetical protein